MALPSDLEYLKGGVPSISLSRSVREILDGILELSPTERLAIDSVIELIKQREDFGRLAEWFHNADADSAEDHRLKNFIVFLSHYCDRFDPSSAARLRAAMEQERPYSQPSGRCCIYYNGVQHEGLVKSISLGDNENVPVCDRHLRKLKRCNLALEEWLCLIQICGLARELIDKRYVDQFVAAVDVAVKNSGPPTRMVVVLLVVSTLLSDSGTSATVDDAGLLDRINSSKSRAAELLSTLVESSSPQFRRALLLTAKHVEDAYSSQFLQWIASVDESEQVELTEGLVYALDFDKCEEIIESIMSPKWDGRVWPARRVLFNAMPEKSRAHYVRRVVAVARFWGSAPFWLSLLQSMPSEERLKIVEDKAHRLAPLSMEASERSSQYFYVACECCRNRISQTTLDRWCDGGVPALISIAARCALYCRGIEPDGRVLSEEVKRQPRDCYLLAKIRRSIELSDDPSRVKIKQYLDSLIGR